MQATGAVLRGARALEHTAFALPRDVAPDEAVLAVEANGMCGTDWDQYRGTLEHVTAYPYIPGHETIGRLERVGDRAAARWGVREGARVAVESTVPCGTCRTCNEGRWLLCPSRLTYGFTPLADGSPLSGGYATHMLLRANTLVYPLPEHLSTEDAVFFNPLGAGFDWAVRVGGTRLGDTVLIIGPGQRGLASVVAASEAGAGRIVVAGRGQRPWKLELALRLGATHVVDTDRESLPQRMAEITDGELADVAVDTTPTAIQPVLDACDCLRPEGTLVLAGTKEGHGIPGFDTRIILKALVVRGAYSVSAWAKRQAIRVLAERAHDLSALHTHSLPVADLDRAMRILGGEVSGEEALHITVTPE